MVSLVKGALQACFKQQETQQYLLAGVDGVGKTTLLFKLKASGNPIQTSAAVRRATQDEVAGKGGEEEDAGPAERKLAFYYEAFDQYALWDVPGVEEVRPLLRMFYQSVGMSAVLFVVSCHDLMPQGDKGKELWTSEFRGSTRPELQGVTRKGFALQRIHAAKRLLHKLLCEQELLDAAFCILVNEQKSGAKRAKGDAPAAQLGYNAAYGEHDQHCVTEGERAAYNDADDPYYYLLGLDDVDECMQKERIRLFHMDFCQLKGEKDEKWRPVLDFIREWRGTVARREM